MIDGESWSESTASVTKNIRRLLKSDEVRHPRGTCSAAIHTQGPSIARIGLVGQHAQPQEHAASGFLQHACAGWVRPAAWHRARSICAPARPPDLSQDCDDERRPLGEQESACSGQPRLPSLASWCVQNESLIASMVPGTKVDQDGFLYLKLQV